MSRIFDRAASVRGLGFDSRGAIHSDPPAGGSESFEVSPRCQALPSDPRWAIGPLPVGSSRLVPREQTPMLSLFFLPCLTWPLNVTNSVLFPATLPPPDSKPRPFLTANSPQPRPAILVPFPQFLNNP